RSVRDHSGAFISMGAFGEVLPRYESYVDLDPETKDAWGIPVLRFHYHFSDNERKMAEDMVATGREMLEPAGTEVVGTDDKGRTNRRWWTGSRSSSSPPMTTPPGRAPPPWRPTSTAVWRNRSSPTGRPSGAPASRPWMACLVSSTRSRSSRPRRTSGSRSSREWRRARRTPKRPPSASSESSRGGPPVDTIPPRSASTSIRNTRGTCTSAANSPGTMRSKGDHDQEEEMRTRFLALGLAFLGAQVLGAQTKLSGAGTCGKPDVTHTIAIADRPNHAFTISKTTCRWTKPFAIGGLRSKGGTG